MIHHFTKRNILIPNASTVAYCNAGNHSNTIVFVIVSRCCFWYNSFLYMFIHFVYMRADSLCSIYNRLVITDLFFFKLYFQIFLRVGCPYNFNINDLNWDIKLYLTYFNIINFFIYFFYILSCTFYNIPF